MQTTSEAHTAGTAEYTSTSQEGDDVRDRAFRHRVDGEDAHRLDRLKTTLVDFTVNCMAEQPCDLIDYGIEFFGGLKSARDAAGRTNYGAGGDTDDETAGNGDATDDEAGCTEADVTGKRWSNCRRLAVLGELFDPEVAGCYDDDRAVGHAVKSDEQRRTLLANISGVFVFGALDVELMNVVIDAMRDRCVRNGDVIIRQGHGCDRFYVVEAGVFEANADRVGQRQVRTYTAGSSFGELALLYDEPCDATVVAKSNGLLWTLDRNSFRLVPSLVFSEYRYALSVLVRWTGTV